MNAVSILIICGFIYLLFVTWMFGKKGAEKERTEHQDTPLPEAGEPITPNPVESDKSKPDVSLVPKSDFNMEEFKKAITESMQTAMIHVLESVVGGEVTPDQVEFKDKDDISELLLSAKPYKSESNFLNGRSWAYFLYLTSPLSRFQVLREGIPMLRRA